MRLLEARPLSASYLQKKLPNALECDSIARKEGLRRDGGFGSAARSAAGVGDQAARVISGSRIAQEDV
jgi:hypothetical protein